MKVIHIIIGLGVGGAEMMLARLVETHLQSAPTIKHRVVSLTTRGDVGERLLSIGIEVDALGMNSGFLSPLAILRLIRLLRRDPPDIVQTWMYHADLIGGLAARFVGVRAILWGIRTTDIAKGGSISTLIIRWLCARLSKWIPTQIVCAAEASLHIHADLGYDSTRLVVIPNGFELGKMTADPTNVATLRINCGIPPEAKVIGMIGRFNVVKGQQDFVRAAGLIANQFPNCWFLMVGAGCDKQNQQLTSWISASGSAEQFVLLGKRSDIPVCLAAMDVFMLPSRTEGFPNVLAEAMAMARPCVATNVGDASKVVAGCGLIVPPEEPEELANAAIRLMGMEPKELKRLGSSARDRIEREYSMTICARRFVTLYEYILSTRNEQKK